MVLSATLKRHRLAWGMSLILTTQVIVAHSEVVPPENDTAEVFQREKLQESYRALKQQLENNIYNAPIVLHSQIREDAASGEVYAILPYDYATLNKELNKPIKWCEAMILHINVKACINKPDKESIHTYLGYSGYQEPEESVELQYNFEVLTSDEDYSHILLHSDFGPYGTSDYYLHLEIIPLQNNTSFLHFSYSLRYGKLALFVLKTYLATFGRNKVGFSVIGSNANGEPEYIGGIEGVVERNAMRYFLALRSYFDTLEQPDNLRFEASLNRWFDLIEKYRRQLYELHRIDYLAFKRKEIVNQRQFQQRYLHPASYQSKENEGVFDF